MPVNVTSRPADRHDQILAQAQRLFIENGIQNVSTRQIAQAVGISQPSLYAHFDSRDAILIELCVHAFGRLRERMIDLPTEGTPYNRLHRMGVEYVAFGLEESAAYRVAFMLERADPSVKHDEAMLDAGLRAFAVLHDLFKEVRGADDMATATCAQSAWASMHGLVALLLARADFPWVERQALIDHHLLRVCDGAFET
jgi:AcrR family transcriptional regulator